MKEKIANLIDVKSILTLTLAIAFGALTIQGTITAQAFMEVFLIVITYYFSKDANRAKPE